MKASDVPEVPEGWKVKRFDEVLTMAQLEEIQKLGEARKITHNALLEIIEKDDSKYKGELYPPYLAYAIEHALKRKYGDVISDNVR